MVTQANEIVNRPAGGASERTFLAAGDRPAPQGKPLRVLFVTPRYLPMMGGVENHVFQVARRLAGAGLDVTVLTTDPQGHLSPDELLEGVRIRRVRAWPANSDYYFAPGVYRTIIQGEWDLIHCQSYHTLVAPLAMLAAIRAGIPYVLTFHGGGHSSWLRNAIRDIQRRMLRPLFLRAERLVATARFEIDSYGKDLGIPRERFVLIPNGAYVTTATQPGTSVNGTLIASVGRLERYKGHQRVLAAMPYILSQRPEARLWIAGEGPYEPTLRRMAQELGIAGRVEIRAIPAGDKDTLAAKLSGAALVALLSEYETHPMAVLEALALGCPVLVADTSGLSELAEQGFARAIPLHSTAEQVATAVLEQLQQPRVPVKLELPTWEDCTEELRMLYETIVQDSRCVS